MISRDFSSYRGNVVDMGPLSPYVVKELENRKTTRIIAIAAIAAVVGLGIGFLAARKVMS